MNSCGRHGRWLSLWRCRRSIHSSLAPLLFLLMQLAQQFCNTTTPSRAHDFHLQDKEQQQQHKCRSVGLCVHVQLPQLNASQNTFLLHAIQLYLSCINDDGKTVYWLDKTKCSKTKGWKYLAKQIECGLTWNTVESDGFACRNATFPFFDSNYVFWM